MKEQEETKRITDSPMGAKEQVIYSPKTPKPQNPKTPKPQNPKTPPLTIHLIHILIKYIFSNIMSSY